MTNDKLIKKENHASFIDCDTLQYIVISRMSGNKKNAKYIRMRDLAEGNKNLSKRIFKKILYICI